MSVKVLNVKNTYNIAMKGKPSSDVVFCMDISEVYLSVESLPFVKPKILVKPTTKVSKGTVLIMDKLNPDLLFLSPCSGVVTDIIYGERRSLKSIVIKREGASVESFPIISDRELANMSSAKVLSAISRGGLLGVFRQYPFRNTPMITVEPPSIYVSLDNDEPYLPQTTVYLDRPGAIDLLKKGLAILRRISLNIYVGASSSTLDQFPNISDVVTHQINGGYPSSDPGVFLYYNKKTQKENTSWGIRGQDVIRLATLFESGEYPSDRLITVAGSLVKNPSHYEVLEGTNLKYILGDSYDFKKVRVILGGILTGRKVDFLSGLGLLDYGFTLITEGSDDTLFPFMRLGWDKPSASRTYLSALLPSKLHVMNSSMGGGDRACIACSACPTVCPVGIYPQFLMKDVLASDLEGALRLGLLDCVSCGLCSYVCPSKIHLVDIFNEERKKLVKDLLS